MIARQERFRILLVDDDASARLASLKSLEHLGYKAEVAASGREALQKLDAKTYNLVLMDDRMPDLDGLEATRELRRREGAGRRTPVVGLSADGDRQGCLAAGMDDYLIKPCALSALAALLARLDVAVDPATLKNLAELDEDPAFFKNLIERFLDDAAKLSAEMKAACAEDKGYERQAHTLKGSSATLGANGLRALCARAETACKEGRRADAKALAFEIEKELRRLSAALRAAVAER